VACVVAALVAGAVASGGASADPVFVTKAVIGEAVGSVPFTGTLGPTFFEGAMSKTKIVCKGGAFTGEVTGPKSVAGIVAVLSGCETNAGKFQTAGKPEGVAETKALAGTLGALTPTQPGLKLYSQAEGKGGTVLEGNIAGFEKYIWKGEVTGALAGAAGEDAATARLLTSLRLTFGEAKGIQRFQGFSEGPEAGLLGQLEEVLNGSPELSGWSSQLTFQTVPSTWGLGVTK
jgi:hypothetical protein